MTSKSGKIWLKLARALMVTTDNQGVTPPDGDQIVSKRLCGRPLACAGLGRARGQQIMQLGVVERTRSADEDQLSLGRVIAPVITFIQVHA